jgi:tetratricopeptide (TPR) repeat protein
MKKRGSPSETLTDYPRGGTFAQLLNWHVAWGTRPKCSVTEKNTPWIKFKLAQSIHEEGTDPASAKTNFRNWRLGKLPSAADEKRVQKLFHELFGDDPKLRVWKDDLQGALESGRKEKLARSKRGKSTGEGNIPTLTRHFVGRAPDVESIAPAIASFSKPYVLIQGGAGIGKTELSKAVAHSDQVKKRFGDRRWFVPLENAATAEAMEDAIARAVGCDPSQGIRAVLDAVRGRPALLILDNLETPWEATDQRRATEDLLATLASEKELALLASFRGRDRVLQPNWHTHPLDVISANAARQMFCDIGGSQLSADPHLDRFIAALGGVPLAIELIARRAHSRSDLSILWKEWNKVGTELAVHPDFASNRLTSLPISIEVSLRSHRITPAALRLFALLGSSPAGLAESDREALLGMEGFEAEERLLRLGLAVERPGRSDLLPPIREYARRNNLPSKADALAWRKYFVKLVKLLGDSLDKPDDESAFVRFSEELPNIELAFRSSIQEGQLDQALDSLPAFNSVAAFGLIKTGVFKAIFDACVSAGNKVGQAASARALGDVLTKRGELDHARDNYEIALRLYRKDKTPEGVAGCLAGLGEIALIRSEYEVSSALYAEAVTFYQSAGNAAEEAHCLFYLGDIELRRRNYDAAEANYQAARILFERLDKRRGTANCQFRLADLAYGRDQHELARATYRECLPYYRATSNVLGEGGCLKGMGDVAQALLEYDTAIAAYEKAMVVYQSATDSFGTANCFINIGKVHLKQSSFEAAKANIEEAQKLYREIGDASDEASCLMYLGDLAEACGDKESFMQCYEEALAIQQRVGDSELAADCLKKLGREA